MTPATDSPASDTYDAIIVGAGPAGLTAATYLGRFHRKVLVLDGGPSRASWIPESHNTPGFPHGVGGEALLGRLREQAGRYGAELRVGRARSLVRGADGFVLGIAAQGGDAPAIVRARFLLLATGVVDRLPDLEGVEDAIRAARVRLCPICDAYEASGQRIAVLGDSDHGAREAAFLTTYSATVTLLDLRPDAPRGDEGGVSRRSIVLDDIVLTGDAVAVRGAGEAAESFDCLYLALGFDSQQDLARQVGAERDDEGRLLVSGHQQTSVDGLYAAGDVVRGLNQIAVATAEAAIAATDIHNRLQRVRFGAASPGAAIAV
ncbi:NAD(P)/FAD-dependent oxidoreductase [Caulobacter segnis]|uniref:Thioredoxin reductase n=1 Tax=Caulobacter segnis TaxID=88688 RepID=A0A2W5VDR7_9CAUL|nr:NAD(P)/FAD-dependent oxidoreductase [Caulobacter segnis]PZR37422.1 MAG: NAD(P)/FAD-dependent oxidoreductase [Caulobacter segnis]